MGSVPRAVWSGLFYEDVAFRVLSGNQQPNFWTLNHFRTRHMEALGQLFAQTVALARKAGLVKLGRVAVDGTKLKANASKHNAMSYGRMQEEDRRLGEEIRRYLEEMNELDKEEDEQYGKERGDELPPGLRRAQERRRVIRKAMEDLEEEARQRARAEQQGRRQQAEEEGRAFHPRKDPEEAKPDPTAQRNFTDPDSRIMVNSDKAFEQAYNTQLAVDADSQIILAADLSNLAPDAPHLPPLLEQVIENTGAIPKEVLADAGYYSQSNLDVLAAYGIEAYIPPERVRHNDWRNQTSPRGRIPRDISPRERMSRKLRTRRGREHYKLRYTSVEPVIGQIKGARGLRQLLHRGLSKVKFMWLFECAVHNLLKMFRAKVVLSKL